MSHAPPSFWRSPRLKTPLPRDEITLPDPPHLPPVSSGSVLAYILPTVAMAVVLITVSVATGMNSMLVLSVPMIITSGAVSAGLFMAQRRKARREGAERQERYRSLLREIDGRLEQLQNQQIALRQENDPPPAETLRRVQTLDRRLWSRLPGDDDFLHLRLGVGDLPSTVQVKTPTPRDLITPDPLYADAAQTAQRYATLLDAPICLDIAESQVIGIAGEREAVAQMGSALIVQAAAYHAPEELKIAALYPAAERARWGWLRWLPHTWGDDRAERTLADGGESSARLMSAIDRMLDARHRLAGDSRVAGGGGHASGGEAPARMLVFILDERVTAENPVIERLQFEGPPLGIYPIFFSTRTRFLPQACRVSVRLDVGQAHLIQQGFASSGLTFLPDAVAPELPADYARAMAPIRLRQAASREIPALVTLLELFGVERVEELRIADRWQRSARSTLRLAAPLGLAAGREALTLDLHEKADGPNGLVAGMVGAGKSELLQTLVAALALEYSPEQLAFVLIDYKGGGMADPFVRLPHTRGIITNLQQEGLARRALTSLTIELERRQQIFADVGLDPKHIDEYHRRRDEGRLPPGAEPIPYLVVIVDEFAEMKTEQPETAKEFVRIARLGRSAGLRLILAMQKPAGIVDGQIEANTRFRLCLRVAQTEDSTAMLKRPDAAYLTGRGRCLLQVGTNEKYREFQVAWAGAPYDPQRRAHGDPTAITAVALDGGRTQLAGLAPGELGVVEERTQLRAVVDALADAYALWAQAHAVPQLPMLWLPPLPAAIALSDIRLEEGWDGARWRPATSWLTPAIGLVDRPRERSQLPLALPLGREGHLAIYSAPGYGKTTTLQTLALSLALTHSPAELHLYLLDFGGRLLKTLEPLPHVGAVICADEEERLERLALFLRRTLDERRELLGAAGVSTLAAYRAQGGSLPAIVVLLDNYANYVEAAGENEARIGLIGRIAQDGGNLGIHLVVTANNSATIRFAVSSNILLAIALHLVEPGEYAAVVGRADDLTPSPLPGRGLLRGNPVQEVQIALPVAGATDAERSQTLRALIARMAQAWSGPTPVRIDLLPEVVRLESVLRAAALPAEPPRLPAGAPQPPLALPLGLHADDLSPYTVELSEGLHLLIAGAAQSGRTMFLRTWAQALAALEPPAASRLIVIDSLRGGLASLRALPHLEGYAATPQEADVQLKAAATLLEAMRQSRRAGDPVPRLTVLVDDLWDAYDDPVSAEGKEAIGRLLREGRGLPFHCVIAGRNGDMATKAWCEPVKSLKEAQRGIVLGSGDDALFNTRLPYQERSRPLPCGEGYAVNRGAVRRVRIAVA